MLPRSERRLGGTGSWYAGAMTHIDRRSFLAAAGAAAAVSLVKHAGAEPTEGETHRGPVVIASSNGLRCTELAYDRIVNGTDPAVAVVEGVGLVEADPNDTSVGLGGMPNERGVVQLDSSVMHGPTHRAGAVAALENILHPAQVALKVLQITDHCLLVGQGALDFARANGFPEQNLLTESTRRAWLRWTRNHSRSDHWLNDDQSDWDKDTFDPPGDPPGGPHSHLDTPPPGWPAGVPFTTGTIHCSALTAAGDLGSCTTTSGMGFKVPGRVGDSPIIGAGLYCDNDIGAAGATGWGEAVIESCGSFDAVREMERGATPNQACLAALKRIVDHSRRQRLRFKDGAPTINVRMFAVRKDGAYGSASIRANKRGSPFAVCDEAGARIEHGPFLYPE